MTAVICWSIKMRMVTRSAGRKEPRYTHEGFAPKGGTNQPRFGLVGWTDGWTQKKKTTHTQDSYEQFSLRLLVIFPGEKRQQYFL